jgi:SAM-dependent methyltransferase
MSQNLAEQDLAAQYDAVPFPSLAVTRSQPDFLASIARLRGLQPVDVSQSRVLELGCAAGQNLIPLAERYPNAHFVGVDTSGRQIATALQVTQALGLTNIEFRQQDILALETASGSFDYIIAQGVYSWVAEPVREKLLAVCRECLTANGVAFVSYKTYPGWQLHDMIRHMMEYDSRHAQTPAERMARSRMLLDFLTQCCTADKPYEQLIREEIEPLIRQSDAYLWHDHLAQISHPVLFEQFLTEVQRHDLQLLGEATLGIRPNDFLNADRERELAALTCDPLQQEQLRDVLRNRAVRQTLLCRADQALSPTMASESLSGMYLSGSLKSESTDVNLTSFAVVHFQVASGARVGTPLPLAKAALMHLGGIWPASIRTEELLSAACSRVEAAGGQAPTSLENIQRLRDNLLQCCLGQVIQIHSGPDAFVPRPSDRPLAAEFARWQASRSEIITSRRHEPVRLDSFDRHVLSLLDGQQDGESLLDQLTQAANEGKLVVMDAEQRQLSGEGARKAFAEAIRAALDRLASAALLIA